MYQSLSDDFYNEFQMHHYVGQAGPCAQTLKPKEVKRWIQDFRKGNFVSWKGDIDLQWHEDRWIRILQSRRWCLHAKLKNGRHRQ